MPAAMHSPPHWGPEMGNWIQHVHEPSRLVLAWQAADERGNRTRFAVGEITKREGNYVLRYYSDTPDVVKAKELGYEGYAAFDVKKSEHTKDVLSAFMRRLPPRSRSDFDQYLQGLRLTPTATLSDFGLLGYSGAKLPSDGFSLVDTLEGAGTPGEFLLELAGYRYYPPQLTDSDIGAEVSLVLEPTNPVDQGAVAVHYNDRKIGFINRLRTPVIKQWMASGRTSAVIERFNGRLDKPRAFIFLRVK